MRKNIWFDFQKNFGSAGAILQMSRAMRKPTTCICKNKNSDQLRSNCEADEHLCFCHTDSTIPLLSKSKISSPLPSYVLVQLVCVEPVRKPHCWFSHDAAHLEFSKNGQGNMQNMVRLLFTGIFFTGIFSSLHCISVTHTLRLYY